MRRRLLIGAQLLALAACSAPADESPTLLREARSAVLDRVARPEAVRFDDSEVVILSNAGLVCGGRFRVADERRGNAVFEPYYFARGRGLAMPSYKPALYAALVRECLEITTGEDVNR